MAAECVTKIHQNNKTLYIVDVLHLPSVKILEYRVAAMGVQRNVKAVFSARIDPYSHTLTVIHKDLNRAFVYKDAKL